MWLELKLDVSLVIDDLEQFVTHVRADIYGLADDLDNDELDDKDDLEDKGVDERPVDDHFVVGRILADRLDLDRIRKSGAEVWEVADSDSSGLEAAWASLLDEQGRFREEDFAAETDPVIYLYRFALHPDFGEWRLAVMDMFCRLCGQNAIILAQHHTTIFSQTEFELLGFRQLAPIRFSAPPGTPAIVRDVEFWRENRRPAKFDPSAYPDEAPRPVISTPLGSKTKALGKT